VTERWQVTTPTDCEQQRATGRAGRRVTSRVQTRVRENYGRAKTTRRNREADASD